MGVAAVESRFSEYSSPQMVVSTDWVAAHLADPSVRVLEVVQGVRHCAEGSIPGAITIEWRTELHDPVRRDIVNQEHFELLMSRKGIAPDSTVVLYSDGNNRYATYALWLFRIYGHKDVRILDGGRAKWHNDGRPWSRDLTASARARYRTSDPDLSIRAFRDEVFLQMEARGPMIDARSSSEYRGAVSHRTRYLREGVQRDGHIPGASNIPWATALEAEDGTFKRAGELRAIYQGEHSLGPDDKIISYCGSGERASLTWFVLTFLLGYPHVQLYDGSWAEWGNLIAAPIER